tara:strand:+ start:449 stop:1471 length:1023 start_codon:yes stop_codon:yes gene_type:complete
MKNKIRVLFVIALPFVLIGFSLIDLDKKIFQYPASWPKPHYNFDNNPLNKVQIELGRKLFYDPILSANNSISCASCHLSYTAFTHVDHALSHGINDSIGTRNSPVLINLAWNELFMWDGAVNNIEVQALAPISHPAEMGEEINHLIKKLQKDKNYPLRFYKAYGDSLITSQHILKSIAQFQLTLVSANAKYDKVKRGDEEFNPQEFKGYELFLKHCNGCHSEPLFTNGQLASNGLSIDTNLKDVGRFAITQANDDSLKFKIPTLRNIEFSQPYMHDGRLNSLSKVLKHYASEISTSQNLKSDLKDNLPLSAKDRVDLVAFLLTLTDKEFLFNPNYSYPLQ